MVMSVVLVHVSCSHLRVVLVVISVVESKEIALFKLELSSYLVGPGLNEIILAGVLGSKNIILMVEAVLKVLFEDAVGLISMALIKKVRDKEMRDPNSVVIRKRQESVRELNLVSNSSILELHIQEFKELGVHGSRV